MNISGNDLKKFDAIVCLSAIDWDFLWQRTQEIMSQFASMGYPVLFIENTGARVPGLRDIPRIWERIRKVMDEPMKSSVNLQKDNINILSPLALPFPYFIPAVKWNSLLLKRKILDFSKDNNISVNRILFWSYMTTPLAVEVTTNLPWAGIVVDIVSDPCKLHNNKVLAISHRMMLESADVVMCASVQVSKTVKHQMKESRHHTVRVFEDGFSTRLLRVYSIPDNADVDFQHIKNKPRIAYIGGINDKIWWDAVSVMAEGHPQYNFVFAGPKDFEELPCTSAANNIFWQPPFEEYLQLGQFLKSCLAGLIPYAPTPYVSEMRPAKINEYLVMGLPIVSTKLPEIERLQDEYGSGIVYVAQTPEQFSESLERALSEDSDELRDKRRKIAESRSWKRVCKELELNLHDSLERS